MNFNDHSIETPEACSVTSQWTCPRVRGGGNAVIKDSLKCIPSIALALVGVMCVFSPTSAESREIKRLKFNVMPNRIVVSPHEYEKSDDLDVDNVTFNEAVRAIRNPRDAQKFALARVNNNVVQGHHHSARVAHETRTGVCKSIVHLIAALTTSNGYITNVLFMTDLENDSGPDHVVMIYRYLIDEKSKFAAYGALAPEGRFDSPEQIVHRINQTSGAKYTHWGIYGLRRNFDWNWVSSQQPIHERSYSVLDLKPLEAKR